MSKLGRSKRKRLRDGRLRRIHYEEFWRRVAHAVRLGSDEYVAKARAHNQERRLKRTERQLFADEWP